MGSGRAALDGGLGFSAVHLRGLPKGNGDLFVLPGPSAVGLLIETGAVHVVDVVLELVFSLEGGAAVGAVERTGV